MRMVFRLLRLIFSAYLARHYSACWEICRKLDLVLVEQMTDGLSLVESALFQEIIFRRTRMTPAGRASKS